MEEKRESDGHSVVETEPLGRLLRAGIRSDPGAVRQLIDDMRGLLGASRARLYVADYSLQHLREIGVNGHGDDVKRIDSSLAGRAFTSAEMVVSEKSSTVFVPLLEGANRVGVLELDYDDISVAPAQFPDDLLALFVLVVMNLGRYSDEWHRARRIEPLSVAAEIQWGILPPLTCSIPEVSIGGMLEPAYSIGGDSFDYAFNDGRLDFSIVDAIGRGMSAVLMSTTTINTIRNGRRAGMDLTSTYDTTGRVIETQFGDHNFVTAQLGSLDVDSGVLSWVSAGNIPPMLVRNGTYGGELECAPSLPLGLGGHVVEIATVSLQRGDRVLFHTDGFTEARSPDRELFGTDRLADLLARSSLDNLSVSETARRLSNSIVDYTGGLDDDATLVLVEYHGRSGAT